MKKLIILYGAPGAGKGTQARLLYQKYHFYNFDTGNYLEDLFYDPQNDKSKVIQREKKLFEAGILCTPSWILKILKAKVKQISEAGINLILSGSPRTMFEAFGDKKTSGLMAALVKGYGRKNIVIVQLEMPEKASLGRNATRLLCSFCDGAIIGKYYSDLKLCPFCGEKLYRRTVDRPEVMQTRIKNYVIRTKPIISKLKKQGFNVIKIDASPMPSVVAQSIAKKVFGK